MTSLYSETRMSRAPTTVSRMKVSGPGKFPIESLLKNPYNLKIPLSRTNFLVPRVINPYTSNIQ